MEMHEENPFESVVRIANPRNILKASYTTHLMNRRWNDDPEYLFTTKIFKCKNNKNVEWMLALVENTGTDSDYISVDLTLERSDFLELQVFFKCTLRKNLENINSAEAMFTLSLPRSNCMHMPKFVEKKVLSSKKLHPFEISCKIRAVPKCGLVAEKQRLASDLNFLWKEEALADVTLVASGKELRAHKAILAARSPVFARMFLDDMREARESRVLIDDIEHEVLRAFVGFAYTSQFEGNCEAMAGALIAAADKYQFEELKRASAILLLRRINVDNAINTLQLAEHYNFTDLKLSTIEFINKHAKAIVKTPAFKSLTHTQAHLIAEIYSVMAMALNDNKEKAAVRLKRSNFDRYQC